MQKSTRPSESKWVAKGGNQHSVSSNPTYLFTHSSGVELRTLVALAVTDYSFIYSSS